MWNNSGMLHQPAAATEVLSLARQFLLNSLVLQAPSFCSRPAKLQLLAQRINIGEMQDICILNGSRFGSTCCRL